jgi:hypothetical protein
MSVATQKSTTSRTAKKSTAGDGSATPKKQSGARRPANKRTAATKPPATKSSAAEVAQAAAAQLGDLTGKEVEGVTSLERTEDGWTVEVDVLELRRIPSTTDVLASYEVDVDSSGELESYRRMHRYVRGVAGEE